MHWSHSAQQPNPRIMTRSTGSSSAGCLVALTSTAKQPHKLWPMRTHQNPTPTERGPGPAQLDSSTIYTHTLIIPPLHNTTYVTATRTPTPLHHHQQQHHCRPTSSSSSSGSRSKQQQQQHPHPHHRPRELPSVVDVRGDLSEDHSIGRHATRLSS